ncbi:MAG: hypothetical protein HY866_11730, partial [Chloroflexi bacterium]|nr:hypothetical protein [Chloroflexota bacterium]
MAYNLLRLAGYTAETRYEEAALGIYRVLGTALSEYPMAFGEMLIGVDFYLRRPQEIAIVGDLADERTEVLLSVIRDHYRPLAVVALAPKNPDPNTVPALLRSRTLRDSAPAVYVCETFVCAAPVTTPEALSALLNKKFAAPIDRVEEET